MCVCVFAVYVCILMSVISEKITGGKTILNLMSVKILLIV